MNEPILRLENICKSIDDTLVLDSVSLQVQQGQFLGIVGTNGAGKTVLANILTGVRKPDRGTIWINGESCIIQSPIHARRLGIYALNQTATLVDKLTIAENVCLEQEGQSVRGFVSWRKWNRSAQSLLDELGIPLSAKTVVGNLNLEQKRLVELARLYVSRPRIMIFDDCFVSLSPKALELMEQVVRRLRKMGSTVIYFSHRVESIFNQCDSVVFIRDSHVTGTILKEEYSEKAAFDAILKEQKYIVYPKLPGQRGRTVLQVKNLSTKSGLQDISFDLKKGEILGVAGTIDSGKHQLARALFGVEPLSGGSVIVNEEELQPTPRTAILHHIGYLPEDTEAEGLLPGFSIESNIGVSKLMKNDIFYQFHPSFHKTVANDYIRRLHIDCTSTKQKVSSLSAGNQQKVNIAKWLQANCSILILEDPFKGIDPANLVDLYNYICQLVAGGISILLMSSNYDELVGLSDRILVLKKGSVENIFSSDQCSVKDLVECTY